MPRGRYSLHDPYDHTPLGDERFHCATGPSGWRYVSQITPPADDSDPTGPVPDQRSLGSVDLTIDGLGRPLRLELHAAGWRVRGSVVDGVSWVRTDRTGERAQEGRAAAHSFTGVSPAFLISHARLLRPALGAPPTRVRLVALTPPVLAPRTIDQTWALLDRQTHPTDHGPLIVEHYRVSDLDTGEQHAVHLAGDVVLAAPGVQLEDLDSPPSTFD